MLAASSVTVVAVATATLPVTVIVTVTMSYSVCRTRFSRGLDRAKVAQREARTNEDFILTGEVLFEMFGQRWNE